MAQHRHKRETNARRLTRSARAVLVAAPLALVATAVRRRPSVSWPRAPTTCDDEPRRRHRRRSRRSSPGGRDAVARAGARSRPDRSARADRPREPSPRPRTIDGRPRQAEGRPARPTPSCGRPRRSTCGPARRRRPRSSAVVEAGEKVLVTGRAPLEPRRDRRRRPVALGHRRLPRDEKPSRPRASAAPAPTAARSTPGSARHRRGARGRLRRLPGDHDATARSAATASTPRASPSTSWSAASAATGRGLRPGELAALGVSYIIYSQQHLVGGARRRGLARHVRPRVDHGEPLRPRARHAY